MALSPKDVRLIRLFAAIVLARWDEVESIRRAAPGGEPDVAWREAVLQTQLFAGIPRTVEAFEVLERAGGLGSPAPDEGARCVDDGRALFDRIYAELADDVVARLDGFHPELAGSILDHAYGRILSRPGLSPDRRELLAVVALAITRARATAHEPSPRRGPLRRDCRRGPRGARRGRRSDGRARARRRAIAGRALRLRGTAVKEVLRDLAGSALGLVGITSPSRLGRDRLTVATFHRVLPEVERNRYPYPMLAVTPEELGGLLDFFSAHFLCTTLAGAFRLFSLDVRPERPLLALTFDDGQLDNFVHARPALESRNLRATFYVPFEAIERREPLWHDRLGFALMAAGEGDRVAERVEEAKTWSPEVRAQAVARLSTAAIPDWASLMTWDQVRTLAAAGHEIGSHSLSHALLPQLDDAAIEREVAGSKAAIEAKIDRPLASFCYPNGDTDDRAARAVAHAGYACAVTTQWGVNNRGSDPFRLRRFDMNPRYSISRSGRLSPSRVAWRMSGLHPGLRF